MVNSLQLSGVIGAKPAVDWDTGVLKLVLSFDTFVIRVRATLPPHELAVAMASITPGEEAEIEGSVTGSINGIYCIADKITTKSGWKHEKPSKMS